MNPEMPSPEPSDVEPSEKSERELGIEHVRERYEARATAERGWLDVPEPFAGAYSQIRDQIQRIEALAHRAEEIFDFEQSLSGKSPEELQSEVERIQAEMDAQRKLQLDIRAMAHEHHVFVDDTGGTPDNEIIRSLDQGELKTLDEQNLLFELKQIAQAHLPKEKKL